MIQIFDIIEELQAFGFTSVIIIILMIIVFVPLLIDSWKKFLKALNLQIKPSPYEQETNQKFASLENNFQTFQEEIYNKQQEYHMQSIEIRNGLIDNQKKLEESQMNLKSDIQSLTKMFQNYMSTDNKKTISTLRLSLWQMHKDFVEQGYVTPDGLKTFTELGKVYEEAGGDDIYHEKLEPEVLGLEIRYPEGSIYEK